MGLFSKILPALEVVGGAVLEFVPGGQLAGAMLITEGLASSGIIGGSVGKFLKSGAGQALMGAVSLGSLAYGMYGSAMEAADNEAIAQAGQESAAQAEVNANAAANQAVTADLGQMSTPSGISTPQGIDVNGGVTPGSAAAGNSTVAANTQAQQINAAGSQIQAQEGTQAAQQAVTPQGNAAVTPGGGAAPAASTANPMQAVKPTATGQLPQGVQPAVSTGDIPTVSSPGDVAAQNTQAPSMPQTDNSGSLMERFFPKNSIGPSAGSAMLTAGGSLLGGLGQGIEQKQAMEQQAAAQQFATRSYSGQTPGTPQVTVPQGYLQRAQALRGMLGQTQGIQPAAPTTPSNPGGGPVPIWQVNSTPRGGMTGG